MCYSQRLGRDKKNRHPTTHGSSSLVENKYFRGLPVYQNGTFTYGTQLAFLSMRRPCVSYQFPEEASSRALFVEEVDGSWDTFVFLVERDIAGVLGMAEFDRGAIHWL